MTKEAAGQLINDGMRLAVIDEIGRLTKTIAPYKGRIDRLEALRKFARTWPDVDKAKAGEAVYYPGTRSALAFTVCENRRRFTSQQALLAFLGGVEYFAHASYPMERWDSLKRTDAPADLLVSEAVGPRKLISTRLAPTPTKKAK